MDVECTKCASYKYVSHLARKIFLFAFGLAACDSYGRVAGFSNLKMNYTHTHTHTHTLGG